ncbi:MAG: hypothetical protein KF850_36470 [Labilithrix sp.]|nr:hypothetical protein [Labilithrix sp.]MBX3217584.1 hypothetical protein [Labilithrix sp.]
MIPKGILGWSTEVSVVAREALNEQVRRDAKIVMPEEQIAPAKLPLTHQAAQKSPVVAVSSKLTQKLVDAGIRVHTIGADRVTSSFYYIAEGGGEAPIRVEGDLVAAVGAMLGERADNAAIERVLDGLVDRLLRSLSKDRIAELSLELAAALPRAAADGTGTQEVDLESFEKELAALVGASEKYATFLEEIASKIGDTNERKVDIPLYGDARKVSQGPFELTVGEQKVALVTHERWLATGPLTEPSKAPPAPAPVAQKSPAPAPVAQRSPAPAPVAQKAPEPKPATPRPAPVAASPAPAPVSSSSGRPLNPPRPGSTPPAATPAPAPAAAVEETKPASAPKPDTAAKEATPAADEAAAKPAPAEEPAAAKTADAPAPAEPAAKVEKEPAPAEPAAKAEKAAQEPASKAAAPVAKAKAKEPASNVVEPSSRDARLATTQKVPRKEKGIPWLWILVLAAAAFAGYRLWLSRQ